MPPDEKYISSIHIHKLGHKIQEIRERALSSIIAKLENGYIFDSELARSRELLSNLFNWFLFEPCSNEGDVLNLIKFVCQSESGSTLIRHCGKQTIQQELDKIKTYLHPKYHPQINEITDFLAKTNFDVKFDVPPLKSNVPLSYRSNEDVISIVDSPDQQTGYRNNDVIYIGDSPIVGSTATTIRGSVKKGSSVEQQTGYAQSIATSSHSDGPTYRITGNSLTEKSVPPNCLTFSLKWQPLIYTDRNVLVSVEDSMKNPKDSSQLFQMSEFFINVLLHDFPAEVFVQRPGIVMIFYELLSTCRSTKLTNIILQCLYNLTKDLQIRINHCTDANMQNLKIDVLPNLVSFCDDTSSTRNMAGGDQNDQFESPEEAKALQNGQFTIPDFCFRTMNIVLKCMSLKQESLREFRPNFNQTGLNMSLILLNELVNVLSQTVADSLWEENQNSEIMNIFKEINNSLSLFGDTLEYFRLESLSLENNLKCRAIYLYLLCTSIKWLKLCIPHSKTSLILPKNFKLSLSNGLLDISLGRLYPKIHKCLLHFVESFSPKTDQNSLKKYGDVMKICDGLSATIRLLKNEDSLSVADKFKLSYVALPSVEFHRNLDYLRGFVDLCSDKLYDYGDNCEVVKMAKETILQLLAHHLPEIQEEMYRLCHKKIIENISTQMNTARCKSPGSQIYFLLNPEILTEIAMFGLAKEQIRHYAQEILLYILKCKIIISDQIWNTCIEALIPALPIIIAHGSNGSTLGRTVVNLVDPDCAKINNFPDIVMLKANVELMFSRDEILRDQAFSRLCWLLASQEDSRDILPKFNTIYDKALSNACYCRKIMDVNKIRKSDHFYQPSSLHQVLDLLKTPHVEPVMRRSALNQISVMMEDHLLHDLFLDSNGLDLMIELMKRALKERDYRDYPDSIIPIVSVIKSLALYHTSVREELSLLAEVFYFTLRGLCLFFAEEKMRQDGSMLLFLLVFKDYVRGSPERGNLCIPALIAQKLLVPFISNHFMTTSAYIGDNLFDDITKDKWSLSSVQIQWNADLYGGFDNLIKIDLSNFSSAPHLDIETNDTLALRRRDLKQIKSSSIHFCVEKYLYCVQSATCFEAVLDCITKLTLYLNFFNISSQLNDCQNNQLLSHPWEKTLRRYVEVLPSSEEDIQLLNAVTKLLVLLVPFYKDIESCWISQFLKNPSNSILDILASENSCDEETKLLSQELLKLITLCVMREHHYLDFYIKDECPAKDEKNGDWGHIIRLISDNLRLNNSQNVYNLAHLDSLLWCLVHLTSRLGWSQSKANSPPKQPIPQLISSLCELLKAFHCGKGESATVSVMGLSISRNVLLVLNHLLAELSYFKVKKWEQCFFDNHETRATRTFLAMWASRDVILRAAALQLFGCLTKSPKASEEMVNDLRQGSGNLWELAMTVLTDHSEAGIVRENAALLLANLSGHVTSLSNRNASPLLSISSVSSNKMDFRSEILALLDEYDFFNHLDIILTSLFTLDYMTREQKSCWPLRDGRSEKSSTTNLTEPREFQINISTPGLIKAVCSFLYNLIDLAPRDVCERLQERGLVKLIFRTVCYPSMTIDTRKELALYCNIIEMNISVCLILKKICSLNSSSIGTVLHTKDCLNVLLTLLDPKNYHTHLSQLLYLRNKLWSDIFILIAVLLDQNEDNITPRNIEGLQMISRTIEETGVSVFLEALCESLGSVGTNDLQNASLVILVALLRIECGIAQGKPKTLETILDTMRTPKTVIMSTFTDNIENHEPKKWKNILQNQYKNNVLEEAYFGKVSKIITPKSVEDIEISIMDSTDSALMAGGELCKILLYLFDLANIQTNISKKKSLIINALTGILCISQEAKKYALKKHLMETVIKQLKDYHIKLSLESVENLRKIQDKKRICPVLCDIMDFIGLLTNFLLNNAKGKVLAAKLALADVVHKLWIWFGFQTGHLVGVLRMLSVYTSECPEACRSLPLTSPVAGTGTKKTRSNVSLLHSLISVIVKEMEQISRCRDLLTLELTFDILHHCCDLLDCRVVISKSNIFQSISRLHPSVSKRQPPWEQVETLWLDFLHSYTKHPEGQLAVAKDVDVLDLVLTLGNSSKFANKMKALQVLRNVAFYQPNRPRLLTSDEFLNTLHTKLSSGTHEEKKIIVSIMWSLAANNQKAKLVFKSAKLDLKLESFIKCTEILGKSNNDEDMAMMKMVLGVLRGGDRAR